MNDNINVAIIGCGDIAGGYDERKTCEGIFSHAGAYSDFEGVKITAAYDVDQKRLRAFCEYWKIQAYDSLDQLLAGRYDIVSVCTPDKTHECIVSEILTNDCTKYIWLEKPLAITYVGAKEIVRQALVKNVGLWLSNQRRWEICHQEIRNMINMQCLGEIVHVIGYYVKGITHIGCTMIDTLRFIFGEIDWVQSVPPFDRGSYGDDLSLSGIIGFKNGGIGSVVGCDGDEYTYSIFEIDAVGTDGRIRIEENGDIVRIFFPGTYGKYTGFQELHQKAVRKTKLNWAMRNGLEMLLADLQTNKRSRHSAEEGLVDMKVVDAMCQSAACGGERIVL